MRVSFSNTSTTTRSTTAIKVALTVLLLCLLPALYIGVGVADRPSRQGTFYPSVQDELSEEVTTPDIPDPEDVPFAFDRPEASVDSLCSGELGTDSEVVEAVNLTLLTVPRWMREAFLDSGWSIQVVSYDIATEDYEGKFEVGSVYGSTSYKGHLIKILNDIRAAANSPIHEFGHWLDSQLGYPSIYSDEFDDIFEGEGELYKQTFGPTCSWDKQEFLAEGFWCYWKSPLSLQKSCPEFYSFIKTSLNSLRESIDAG